MALVACPECGQNISSGAVSCPHCERPLDPSRSRVDYVTGATLGMQPRPGARVARTPLRYPSRQGMWLMFGGSVGVILGSFMPWVRLGPVSISGIEGDGKVTAAIGVLMVILAVAARTSPSPLPRIFVTVSAVMAIAVAVTDANRLIDGGLDRQLIGVGLGTILTAGVIAVVGSFLRER